MNNNKILKFSNNYIDFLNVCKTERLAVKKIESILLENGFCNIDKKDKLIKGDKVYFINKNKSVFASIIGDDIDKGLSIIGSHIDSPRLDLKPNPLFDFENLSLLKTHYYGGIKKYQWTCIPLSIIGVIIKNNGDVVDINIGGEKDDFTFTISDLLPHLAKDQMNMKLSDAIKAEDLNIIIGNKYVNNNVKNYILDVLKEKYNIEKEDFLSAELEVVPSFNAKSLGFDKSMVAGYGQDDRVCVYTSLMAFLDSNESKKTKVIIFSDKEEIGSVGNTGMHSNIFDVFINDILNKLKINKIGKKDKILSKSQMLSADVGAGLDPNYKDAFEINNASKIGFGVEINKYTGSKGKYNSNDASAELTSKIKHIFDNNNVKYQFAELGKVDLGGGGTIAYILANKAVDVIDCGVPVISMHSPYEITSKFDIYEAYRAYKVFYEEI